MTVNIDSIDRTTLINWQSIQIHNTLTSEVDTMSFEMLIDKDDYKPTIGDDITVYDGATKIFGGEIIELSEEVEGAKFITLTVNCKDYTHLFDKKLVVDTYEDMEITDIVKAIVDTYCPGFTYVNALDTGTELEYILFDYEQPSKCLDKLADMIGFDWYVDYDKDIHFFNKQIGETSAFNLTDTNGKYEFDSLKIKQDETQLRNVVYVRGGEYVGDSREDKVGVGDNVTKAFKLPYRYDVEPTVTVGGGAQTVGEDGLDSEDDFDCLWNYNEKIIKFKTPPAAGDVKVTGLPLFPVMIKAKRGSSVSVYGETEYVVIDKTIKTKQAARQRAEAEFNDYAVPVRSANFRTISAGLRAGQRINIQSNIRSISESFMINRVTITMRTPTTGFYYDVQATSGEKLGIITFLQKQIEGVNSKIGVIKQEGEVVDVIVDLQDIDEITITEDLKLNDPDTIMDLEAVDDTLTVSESYLRIVKDSPPNWVYAPYFPINDGDRKRPARYDRGCNYVA